MRSEDVQSVDTNVILRLVLGDVPSQRKRAINLLLNGHRYFVPEHVISEAVFTMERGQYKIGREKIADSLCSILDNKCIVYDKELFNEVFPYYVSHPRLSFVDCLLGFEVAKTQREPLWTFDQDFAKQSPTAKLVP
ncbi:PIN domain-containing protein [Candidatus Saccharibacteria bacterium]|nr:PIN domain-containing protein [Candidatus Saccharibacteria bacterium]